MTRLVLQMIGLATAATLAVILVFHLVLNLIDFGQNDVQSMLQFQSTKGSPSRLGKFKTAAVSSDGVPCSKIGR